MAFKLVWDPNLLLSTLLHLHDRVRFQAGSDWNKDMLPFLESSRLSER